MDTKKLQNIAAGMPHFESVDMPAIADWPSMQSPLMMLSLQGPEAAGDSLAGQAFPQIGVGGTAAFPSPTPAGLAEMVGGFPSPQSDSQGARSFPRPAGAHSYEASFPEAPAASPSLAWPESPSVGQPSTFSWPESPSVSPTLGQPPTAEPTADASFAWPESPSVSQWSNLEWPIAAEVKSTIPSWPNAEEMQPELPLGVDFGQVPLGQQKTGGTGFGGEEGGVMAPLLDAIRGLGKMMQRIEPAASQPKRTEPLSVSREKRVPQARELGPRVRVRINGEEQGE